jgi:predicted cobalt transporter CbtA
VRKAMQALAIGIANWALLFLVAVPVFPLRASARPLFESAMTVALALAATATALFCQRRGYFAGWRGGLLFGLAGAAVCVLIDVSMMLPGGALAMPPGDYAADIGLSYLVIPVVYLGVAIAASRRGNP